MHQMMDAGARSGGQSGSIALFATGIGLFVMGFLASSEILFMLGGVAWAVALGMIIVARHKARDAAVMAALSEPPPPPEAHRQSREFVGGAVSDTPSIEGNPFLKPLDEGVISVFPVGLEWVDDEEVTAPYKRVPARASTPSNACT